jgi:hypothetical protein
MCSQQAVLIVRGLGRFLEILNFLLEILQVLLLALAERPLRRSVLRFPLRRRL